MEVILNLPIPSELFFSTQRRPFAKLPIAGRILLGFRPLSAFVTPTPTRIAADEPEIIRQLDKRSILLDNLRSKHLNNAAEDLQTSRILPESPAIHNTPQILKNHMVSNFGELGLYEEAVTSVEKMGISVPTEIQCIGIPAVLQRKNVVLGSHTGSGKTLAYLLPIVQLLRMDEISHGIQMRPRRPRAIVLCPTRELSEQVFHVAKDIGHHARFKSTMVSGGGRLRPQEDALNERIDMVVGTPGRVLKHIDDGNIVYGDIKYLVLDEADTMFDRGFGPDIRKFLAPLKNRASKSGDQGYQTVLVMATMTRAVQNLIDEEFQGIEHLHTSTLHKKIATARHDFIKLSGSENKLEALIQVLKPSASIGNKVMIFCNTLTSCRAVDHFLGENNIYTANYHGEVPADQRVENLQKFKVEDANPPALVCTDLAARGLDLDVGHVIMFDFPLNPIDYLHRTGRTARMGAKGKVTSLVAKRDAELAALIEEAITKNESLESLAVRERSKALIKTSNKKSKIQGAPRKIPEKISARTKYGSKTENFGSQTSQGKIKTLIKTSNQRRNYRGTPVPSKISTRTMYESRTEKFGSKIGSKGLGSKKQTDIGKSSDSAPSKLSAFSGGKKQSDSRKEGAVQKSSQMKSGAPSSKLRVAGFRGRSSMLNQTDD